MYIFIDYYLYIARLVYIILLLLFTMSPDTARYFYLKNTIYNKFIIL